MIQEMNEYFGVANFNPNPLYPFVLYYGLDQTEEIL